MNKNKQYKGMILWIVAVASWLIAIIITLVIAIGGYVYCYECDPIYGWNAVMRGFPSTANTGFFIVAFITTVYYIVYLKRRPKVNNTLKIPSDNCKEAANLLKAIR